MNVVNLKRSIQVGGVCLLASLFLSTASFADDETGQFDIVGADLAPADFAAQSTDCTENCDQASGEFTTVQIIEDDFGGETGGPDIEQFAIPFATDATKRGVVPSGALPAAVSHSGVMSHDECQRMFSTHLEFCVGRE